MLEGQTPEHVRSGQVRTRPFGTCPGVCPSGLPGAVPSDSGAAEFGVRAPGAATVAVELDGSRHELGDEGDGVWAGELPASAGDDCRFVLGGGGEWPAKLRLAQTVVLFSPLAPLLFQGEDYGETAPFQFFTDHIDPFIAATRDGRRREFAASAGFTAADVPDPQSPETFERSKLSPRSPDPFVAELIRLRRELPCELDVRVDKGARTLELRCGAANVRVDFVNETVELGA